MREEVGNSLFLSGYTPQSGPNGVYEMFSHPGCFEPYNGRSRRESVYVVGLNTELERVFLRKQAKDAIRYSKEVERILNHLNANTLCAAAMTELFGD